MSEKPMDYWHSLRPSTRAVRRRSMRALPCAIGADEGLRAFAGAGAARPAACQHDPCARCIFCCCAARNIRSRASIATLGGTAVRRRTTIRFRSSAISSLQHETRDRRISSKRASPTPTRSGAARFLHPGFRAIAAAGGRAAQPDRDRSQRRPQPDLGPLRRALHARRRSRGRDSRPMRRSSSIAELQGPHAAAARRRRRRSRRRIGLERNPVDLEDADDRDWLRALVWPDHTQRLDRLDRAIALFRARSRHRRDPPGRCAGARCSASCAPCPKRSPSASITPSRSISSASEMRRGPRRSAYRRRPAPPGLAPGLRRSATASIVLLRYPLP